MVDSRRSPTPFSARLDQALALLEMDNAEFARQVHPETGQQKVRNWRVRGRIGHQSVGKVREILEGISMEWLNEGIGAPLSPIAGTPIAEPESGPTEAAGNTRDFAERLLSMATPRSKKALETIIEASEQGRLTDDDVDLLARIAARFQGPGA